MAESDGGDFASNHPQNSMANNKNSTLRCTFSAPSHSATLLRGLAVLRDQGQLLDVVLSINEEQFHVHKAVLASCSDYFRAMFTGGMRESSQDSIELKGLSARGLKHIIDFAYSAEVTLDLDCIQDVLGAAVFLQMVPVVELCEEFLKSAMSVETCLNIGQMATTFNLASLKESVDAFTCRHFLQIAEEEDFLHLPMERLVFFLKSNKLKNCSEIDLFHAAVRWLQHDESRREEADGVLRHVRFPLMRSSELVDSVQTVSIMVEDERCRQYLLEAFNYQILPFRQHEMRSPRTLIRSDAMSLITFGGTPYTDNDRTVSGKVYYLADAASRQFKELTEMEAGCSHACVAVLDNFVYVVGGQHLQYRSGEGAVDSCFRYDPHLSQWLRVPPLQDSPHLSSSLMNKTKTSGGPDPVPAECPAWTAVRHRGAQPVGQPVLGGVLLPQEEPVALCGAAEAQNMGSRRDVLRGQALRVGGLRRLAGRQEEPPLLRPRRRPVGLPRPHERAPGAARHDQRPGADLRPGGPHGPCGPLLRRAGGRVLRPRERPVDHGQPHEGGPVGGGLLPPGHEDLRGGRLQLAPEQRDEHRAGVQHGDGRVGAGHALPRVLRGHRVHADHTPADDHSALICPLPHPPDRRDLMGKRTFGD